MKHNRNSEKKGRVSAFRDGIFLGAIWLLILFAFGIESPPTLSAAEESDDTAVVAEGDDGFRVTEREVKSIRRLYRNKLRLETPGESAYLRETVKLKLFATEARLMGLKINLDAAAMEDEEPALQEAVRMRTWAKAYINYKVINEPVDEIVIESYFRSNPEKYGEIGDDGEVLAAGTLSEEIEKEIKLIILKAKFNDISKREKEALMSKYNVRML